MEVGTEEGLEGEVVQEEGMAWALVSPLGIEGVEQEGQGEEEGLL